MDLPVKSVFMVVGLHAVINTVTWVRLKSVPHISVPEFALQLTLDTLVLALLLYFAGGYTNPFVSLLLLPLVVAASILPQLYAWIMAALTIACYTILMFYYLPLPDSNLHALHQRSEFGLHVLGMWFSFLLSASLIIFFVVRMANSLRARDHALAEAREQFLYDEHLVKLGTLATGAAHELGTPLATMAVLANELKHDYANDPAVLEKVEIFRSQIDRCKAIISDISASTGQARGEGGRKIAIDDYLHETVQLWQNIRPQARLTLTIQGPTPAPQILTDKTLTQAIINILNNAADASNEQVAIEARWDTERLILDVCDRGPGLDEAVMAAVGTAFFTTKIDGHGLGLYLAQAVLNRYNGSLELNNQPAGGVRVRLQLPLTALEI
jgi:two-component system sensor histidine kinase RegB